MDKTNVASSVIDPIVVGDVVLNRIGLGTNRIKDNEANKQFLRDAVNLGVNFIDTAHVYAGGESETTIGGALATTPSTIVIATKGGMGPDGSGDNNEEFIRSNLSDSLVRLQTDCITLYQIHRLDTKLPIELIMETMKSLQSEGKIKHIGLSEVNLDQLKAAQKYARVASVQNQYSLTNRSHEEVLKYCTQNGIIFIPWFPLRDINQDGPLQEKLMPVAKKYKASPQQLALAWLLKKSPFMLPIPGTLSKEHLKKNLDALNITLTNEDFQDLSRLYA